MRNVNRHTSAFLTVTAVVLYFFSGLCSLTYEIIWQRLLKLTLGNTTYATSITVAVFMGGLALGAFLIRKRADALRNKLLVYGIIELLVAFFALLTPVFLKAIDSAYIFIFHQFAPSQAALLALQVIVSTVILAFPTVLMGATLPILASLIVRRAATAGWETGLLYSINTFGALVGAMVTGFYLIRVMGVYPAYFLAVGLNIGIAAVSVILSRLSAEDATGNEQPEVSVEVEVWNRGERGAVYFRFFIMGFVALGYEIAWMRTVVQLLKAEIYTFASVLSVYLFGYAAGVLTGSWLAGKKNGHMVFFFAAASLVGLFGVFYLPLVFGIFDSPTLWNYRVFGLLADIFGYLPHLYLSMLFFFLPSFCMGVCFPLLVQEERDFCNLTGVAVSRAYGINTLGCVFGSAGTGFVLIPVLGVEKTMHLLGLAAVIAGWSALPFMKRPVVAVAGLVLPAACIVVAFLQPSDLFPRWVNKCEAKGTYAVQLVDFKEGMTTTASVHRYLDDSSTVISTAGINVAGDALPLRQTQKFQGHFPVILHGHAKSVVTVGFGSGELTKLLTLHGIPDITCVEISPEMVWLSRRYFSQINLGNDLEKYVHMVYMDAKNFMHLTNKRFDIIENDCVWPGTFAESSSLYTREYFLDCKRRLNEDGIFSTWLTLDLPQTTLASIVRTFGDVFENTLFVYPHHVPDRHILLVGQKKGHAVNYGDAQREFNKEKVRESLSDVGIQDFNDLLGCIVADYSSLGPFVEAAAVNSDYFPFVEFDMNRARLFGDKMITWKNLGFILHNTQRVDYRRLVTFSGPYEALCAEVLDSLAVIREADEYLLESFCMHSLEERRSLVDKGLKIIPENPDLLKMKEQLIAAGNVPGYRTR